MKLASLIATVLLNVLVGLSGMYIHSFPLIIGFFLFCFLSGMFIKYVVKGSNFTMDLGWGLFYGCLFIATLVIIVFVMKKLNF
jgi:hypothetical protein